MEPGLAIGLHVAVIALLVIPLFTNVLAASTEAKNKLVNVRRWTFRLYAKLPAGGTKPERRRGKQSNHDSHVKGEAPQFQWTQLHLRSGKDSESESQAGDGPSLLGPPDLKVASPNMANFGDLWQERH